MVAGRRSRRSASRVAASDVFISYAQEDRKLAQTLRDLLVNEGWDVWWDQELVVGEEWTPQIEKALDRARIVLVLWSRDSVRSRWVRKEAGYALAAHRLVAAKCGPCRIPGPFPAQEMALLTGWRGEADHPELQQLFRGLARRVVPSRIDLVRPGYDPSFLGKAGRVGWPSVPGPAQRLHYLHFTVVMNPARRLAWYVAYNAKHLPRARLPERRGDTWAPDPLIAKELQPCNEHFKDTGYDRGHLMSRGFASWGTRRAILVASRQAFFWTNMSPQHPHVNQRSYLAIERWERELGVRCRGFVGFAGPVFSEADQPFHGTETFDDGFVMRDTFRMPKAYWKVVAALVGKPERLGAAAFRVENGPCGPVMEATRLQVGISALERATGLAFPKVLHEAKSLV